MPGGHKRSKAINLVLLPTALLFGALPVLDGCKKHVPEEDAQVEQPNVPASDNSDYSSSVDSNTSAPAALGDMFDTAAKCKAARVDPDDPNSDPLYPPEECDRAYAQSIAQHLQNAPKFNTLAECEAQFGPTACGATSAIYANIPTEIIYTQQPPPSGFMPFMTGYMLGSLGSGGHYTTTSVYYPAGSWRSSVGSRPLIASGGFGYSQASASRPIGYVARNTTALSSTGGFGSRATVVAPTATGAPPSNAAFRTAISPRAAAVSSQSFGSSLGSVGRSTSFGTTTAPSTRGGFGMSASSHAGGFGGGGGFGG